MKSADIAPAASLEGISPFRRPPEGLNEVESTVRGSIPEWLRGELVRTCPAVFAQGGWKAEHWFDALGMLYAFRIGDEGGVSWRGRLLDCAVARDAKQGRALAGSFGSPMTRGLLRRLLQPVPPQTDNTNVNLVRMGDDYVAMTESAHQLMIDPGTLEVRGRVAYDDSLPRDLMMTAHPQGDFSRGRIVNVGTSLGAISEMVVYEHAPHERKRQVIGRWRPRRLPYMHSFGLTPAHALLLAHPFSVNPLSMLWSNAGFINHFQWRPSEGTRIVDIERGTGRVREYETKSMFVFHTVNAFEDTDGLVFDVLAYEDAGIVERFRVDALERQLPNLQARMVRMRLRPGRAHAVLEPLTDVGFEFPCINYRRFTGKAYRWCWGASSQLDGESYRSEVVKLDTHTGKAQRFGQGDWLFGEPLFVARPGAEQEDDGVLVSVATRTQETASALVVLDAATLEPKAWAEVPLPIPLGFHGSFFLKGASRNR